MTSNYNQTALSKKWNRPINPKPLVSGIQCEDEHLPRAQSDRIALSENNNFTQLEPGGPPPLLHTLGQRDATTVEARKDETGSSTSW